MLQRRRLLQLGTAAIALRTRRSLPAHQSTSELAIASEVRRSLFADRCIQPGLPEPRFWFGDWVCHEWICDDELDPDNLGKTLRDYGVVIGLFFSDGSSRYRPGWHYFISWRWVGGEAVSNTNWDDSVHESGLKRSGLLEPPRCR